MQIHLSLTLMESCEVSLPLSAPETCCPSVVMGRLMTGEAPEICPMIGGTPAVI